MGATLDGFVKYPRTPQPFGSKGTDDDKYLGPEESEAFIADWRIGCMDLVLKIAPGLAIFCRV